MEEILQDPSKFEELLKEREKQTMKAVKKISSPIPSRKSESKPEPVDWEGDERSAEFRQ